VLAGLLSGTLGTTSASVTNFIDGKIVSLLQSIFEGPGPQTVNLTYTFACITNGTTGQKRNNINNNNNRNKRVSSTPSSFTFMFDTNNTLHLGLLEENQQLAADVSFRFFVKNQTALSTFFPKYNSSVANPFSSVKFNSSVVFNGTSVIPSTTAAVGGVAATTGTKAHSSTTGVGSGVVAGTTGVAVGGTGGGATAAVTGVAASTTALGQQQLATKDDTDSSANTFGAAKIGFLGTLLLAASAVVLSTQ